MRKLITTAIVLFSSFYFLVSSAYAAKLFMAPKSGELNIGQTFNLDIKVDTEGQAFNAAQAIIKFPKDVLEVKSIDTSPTATIFNFWLEGPEFSNEEGRVNFIGGTTNGVSGSSIPILRIIFSVKGSGAADIVFSDAAVTASDGSGTNILSEMQITMLTVSPKAVAPAPAAVSAAPTIPPPQLIIRTPEPAEKLPGRPKVSAPLYPDPSQWYNIVADFLAQWPLPPDISDVSAVLDKNSSLLSKKSEGLFESKIFPAITEDGIWYLHVRFKNNFGWGPETNYRLAVDTLPPLAFAIESVNGFKTDNPGPTLQFKTSDSLSGLKEYQVRIDDENVLIIRADDFNGGYQLPIQPPGKHQVLVRVIDNAGNGIETAAEMEILPIASPTITYVTKELFSDEEKGLVIKGTALPVINVLLRVYRKEALVVESMARSDAKGNWESTFDQVFKNGNYKVTVQSQDARGALSLAVDSPLIKVKSKPIIQIGPLQLGKGGVASILLLLLIAGFGGGIWYYKKRREKLALRVTFAGSEAEKMINLINKDVEQLEKAKQTPTPGDDEYALNRLKENIKRMGSYIKKGIEKIKK